MSIRTIRITVVQGSANMRKDSTAKDARDLETLLQSFVILRVLAVTLKEFL